MTAREKRLDIAMLLGTAAAIITAMFAGFARECDELRESTFRLHILANSDSESDQRIKYALRDYILDDLGDVFGSCGSAEQSRELAERNLGYITARANEFLADIGSAQTARCSVETCDFPTRVYGETTLPAGEYSALRIEIGAGAGKNWWCVLYPKVCVGAASLPRSPLPRRELYERRKAADRATADSLKAQRGEIEFRFALYDALKALLG
ncbi:MAG: stage II sporulation protein R [Ruminiclostridium sp.]|nr:stage II sporulation protein R [Ruminiclostridium sp.]